VASPISRGSLRRLGRAIAVLCSFPGRIGSDYRPELVPVDQLGDNGRNAVADELRDLLDRDADIGYALSRGSAFPLLPMSPRASAH
jgi:hypothetical protein